VVIYILQVDVDDLFDIRVVFVVAFYAQEARFR